MEIYAARVSHARRSLAIFALLLGALGVLAGCGDDRDGGASAGGVSAGKVADTAPCERLTLAMAERVLRAPKLEKPEAGVDGCSLRAISTASKQDDQRDADLSLSAPQTPKQGGAPVPADIDELRKKPEADPDTTTRKVAVGSEGFISFSNAMHFAFVAWTDGDTTYVLDYNAFLSPQQGKLPVTELIAMAKEIAGE